jgi:hypothetical protein
VGGGGPPPPPKTPIPNPQSSLLSKILTIESNTTKTLFYIFKYKF